MTDNQLPAELWTLSEAYLEAIETFTDSEEALSKAREAVDLARLQKDRARESLATFFKASKVALPITIELDSDRLITFSNQPGESRFRLVVTPKALPKPLDRPPSEASVDL